MVQILVVDDSPVVREEVSEFLTTHGFSVITAEDGVDGLQKLSNNQEIKLVISDVNMPRMNGLTMIEKIRQDLNNHDVHIVMLTTESDPEMKARGKAAGIKGWIVKPFVGSDAVESFKRLVQ